MNILAEYTEKQLEILSDIAKKCALELAMELNSDVIDTFNYSGNLTDDEDSKRYVACALTTMGAIDTEGKNQGRKFIDDFSEGHDIEVLTKIVQKCSMVDGDTIEDRGYNFYKCFWTENLFGK
ncbi:uncharacterized protein LOC131428432 [Malaya genurostris]|uniref:uncharacterized protein LOC131428432 n=1 Tax=Malaya genurostris TaxID=325434 RepID=UPI0026F396A7|nr:uncharacterized protein LOC131428432 [Malaya genurostris]